MMKGPPNQLKNPWQVEVILQLVYMYLWQALIAGNEAKGLKAIQL